MPPLRISKLETLLFRAPIEEPLRTSFGVLTSRPALLVRAEDADGAVGWGEIWCVFPPCGAEHRAALVATLLAPIVTGEDWSDPAAAYDAMTRRTHGTLYQWRSGLWRGLPIADWTGLDVFAFLLSTSTPYMPLYDWDDEQPPHSLRMSWVVAPDFLSRGHGAWLRRHDPGLWRTLCAAHPGLDRLG